MSRASLPPVGGGDNDDHTFVAPIKNEKMSDDDKQFLLDALTNNRHVFNTLDEAELHSLTCAFEHYKAKKDETIVQKGDDGEHFYILHSGKLAFVADGIELGCATVPGNSFGQLALLNNAPHAATCIAVDDEVELWRIDKATFLKFVSREVREKWDPSPSPSSDQLDSCK